MFSGLILCPRLSATGFITQASWIFHFHQINVIGRKSCVLAWIPAPEGQIIVVGYGKTIEMLQFHRDNRRRRSTTTKVKRPGCWRHIRRRQKKWEVLAHRTVTSRDFLAFMNIIFHAQKSWVSVYETYLSLKVGLYVCVVGIYDYIYTSQMFPCSWHKYLRVKEDEANEQHKSIIEAFRAAAPEWTFEQINYSHVFTIYFILFTFC